MRNQYILDALSPILKEIFDFYDISTAKVDPSIHIVEGWPIGTDIYIISGFFNSEMYVHRMYIVKEAIDSVVDHQIVKLVKNIRDEISNKEKFNLPENDNSS